MTGFERSSKTQSLKSQSGRQESNLRPSATTAVRVASCWRVSDRRGRTRPTIDAIGGRHQVLLPLAWAQDQADAIQDEDQSTQFSILRPG
jgi:hypothetical protein